MGKYVSSVLTNDEKVLYEAHLHWKIFFVPVLFILFGVNENVLLSIGILLLINAVIVKKTSEFSVTNKRVIIKTGFIARKAFDILLDKIEGVYVEQMILGRTLNYGKIIIHGTGSSSQQFRSIADPLTFKRMIDEAIEKRRLG